MKKISFALSLLLTLMPLTLEAQNLSVEDELFLADPDPRFHGQQVESLQRFLLFNGIDIGIDGIDGWFGKDTHNALLQYQSKRGLEETGKIKIKDFSFPLILEPQIQSFLFSGWMEGPFPGNEYDGEVLIPERDNDFTYSSYFGSLTIPQSEIETMAYGSFIHSPDKRFIVAFNGDNTSVSLWDVLSETKIEYPIEETAKDTSYQYLPKQHTQFEGESLSWWVNPISNQNYPLLILSFVYQGPQQKDRSLILINPYIQQEI